MRGVRIAYGIFGYGRGHATRALAVLPELRKRHEVVVFAGGDAHDALAPHVPVVRIPTLEYAYKAGGHRSISRTLRTNAGRFQDVVFGGPSLVEVMRSLSDLRPDLAICDAEPWTHTACARLGIPRISFDHFGVLAWCRPPLNNVDKLLVQRDVITYRLLVGRPNRVIVSSFYDAPVRSNRVRVIPPLLRDEVHEVREQKGEHLLVYLNQGRHQLTPRIEEALRALGLPVILYGTGREGQDQNLWFKAPGDRPFLEDLSRCVAVLSTAGNQLVGEAMHFGKPMMVMPENSVEQRVNALALSQMGIGERTSSHTLDAETLARFLRRAPAYGTRARSLRRDGRAEAVAVLESFISELQWGHRLSPVSLVLGAWRFA